MKQLLLLVLCSLTLYTSCASGNKDGTTSDQINDNNSNKPDTTGTKMKVKIGDHTFGATLYDNATARAFKSFLPLTVNMVELNGNEKYVDLSKSLPTNASHPKTIEVGDLMLYGSSTLVLFYKTFSSSYSYTKLGRINDVRGIPDVVGSGNVTVIFELE